VYKWVVPRFRVFYCSQAVTINQTSLDGGNDSSFLGLSSNEFLELFCNVDLEPFFPAFNKFVHFLLNDEETVVLDPHVILHALQGHLESFKLDVLNVDDIDFYRVAVELMNVG